MNESIWKVLDEHGKLDISAAELDDTDDLFDHGLTSHGTVNVMLGLEDAFDVEFPDRLLRRTTFQSVGAIRNALSELGAQAG